MDLLKLAVVLLLVGVVAADVLPTLPSKLNSDSGGYYFNSAWSPMSGGGDYAMTYVEDFKVQQIRILKRNGTGFYEHVANKSSDFSIKDLSTDGRFFTSEDNGRGFAEIFELDAGFNVINNQTVPSPINYGKLLEDGTFVAITGTSLITYTYENNKWVQKDNTSYGGGRTLLYYGQLWPYHLTTETFLAVHMDPKSTSYVFLMRRNPDLSWTFVDQFDLDILSWTSPYSTVWDGDDTIIMGHPAANDYGNGTLYGRITIRVKDGDQWVVQKNITMTDLEGFTAKGYLGFNLHMVTKDTVLVTVPDDGVTDSDFTGGAVVMLTRNTAREWVPVAQFRGEPGVGHMGIQARSNDKDILMLNIIAKTGINGYLFTYGPTCSILEQQPICSDTDPIELTAEQCAGDTPPSGYNPQDYYQLPTGDCIEGLTTDNAFVRRNDSFILTITFTREDFIVYACTVKFQCLPPGAKGPQGKVADANSLQAISGIIILMLALLF